MLHLLYVFLHWHMWHCDHSNVYLTKKIATDAVALFLWYLSRAIWIYWYGVYCHYNSPHFVFCLLHCIMPILTALYPIQGTDFRRQNLTSIDVRFWLLKSISALKDLKYLSWPSTHNLGIQKWKELTKTFVMGLIKKKLRSPIKQIYFSALRVDVSRYSSPIISGGLVYLGVFMVIKYFN